MSEPSILFSVDGGLARITLNRPDAANAMNLAFMRELQQLAHECDTNDAIRAVLLTGSGKMFSAGGDLSWFGQHMDTLGALLKEATFYLHDAIKRFANMPKPLVIAINGAAAGAGFSLAILGDYKVAAQSSSFTMAYTAAGLSPDGGSSYLLPRLVGQTKASLLLFTGRRVKGAEAVAMGLADELVPQAQVRERAHDLAGEIAASAPLAVQSIRATLRHGLAEEIARITDHELTQQSMLRTSDDFREGIAATTERRPADFKGH